MTDEKNNQSSLNSALLLTLKLVIVGVVIFYISKPIYTNFFEVKSLLSSLNIALYVLGIFLIFLYMTLNSLLWYVFLRYFGVESKLTDVVWTFYISMFGKYIPGKIWLAASRIFSLKGGEGKREIVLGTIILEHAYLMLTGVLFFLITWSPTIPNITSFHKLIIILIFVCSFFIIVLFPHFLTKIFNTALSLFKKETIDIYLTRKTSTTLFFLYLFTWMFNSIGIWLTAASLFPISMDNIFLLGSAFSFSYVIGLATLLSPGGIGVREGLLTLLTSQIYPVHIASTFSLLLRISFTICEIIGFLLVSLTKPLFTNPIQDDHGLNRS